MENKKEEVINEIIEKASKFSTDREKLEYIFDWFIKNVKYSYEYCRMAEIESIFLKKFAPTAPPTVGGCLITTLLSQADYNYNILIKKALNKELIVNRIQADEQDVLLAKEWHTLSILSVFFRGLLLGDSFEKKYGVCQHFARDFKILCDRLNIPCIVVRGTTLAKHLEHAWNAVKVNGEVSFVDITYGIFARDKKTGDPKTFFLIDEADLNKISNRIINENSRQALKMLSQTTSGVKR